MCVLRLILSIPGKKVLHVSVPRASTAAIARCARVARGIQITCFRYRHAHLCMQLYEFVPLPSTISKSFQPGTNLPLESLSPYMITEIYTPSAQEKVFLCVLVVLEFQTVQTDEMFLCRGLRSWRHREWPKAH